MKMIVCLDKEGGLGKDGGMAWKNREETHLFKRETMGGVLIVGRRTFQGLGALRGRGMVVLTSGEGEDSTRMREDTRFMGRSDLVFEGSVERAVSAAYRMAKASGSIWVIGGRSVYEQMLPWCTLALVTVLDEAYETDVEARFLMPDELLKRKGAELLTRWRSREVPSSCGFTVSMIKLS